MEAGNISLHLPSTQFVNVGSSKSEGLFGIKMVHKLGPLDIQSIVSKEQVKKTNKSLTLESSEGNYINAYNYLYVYLLNLVSLDYDCVSYLKY